MIPKSLFLLAALALPIAPAVAAPRDETVHVVEPGETLNGIANRAGVSSEALAKANGLKAPYVVRLGQKLAIPRSRPAPVKTAAPKPDNAAAPARASGASATAKAAAAASSTAKAAIAAAGPPEQESVHVVQPGETLGGIAAAAKVPRVLIAEANGLQPPYAVRSGQKLQIPRTRRHTVKAGDTGFSISYKYAVPWEQVALANGLDPAAPVKPGQTLLIPTLLDPPPASGASVPVAAPTSAPTAAPLLAIPAPQSTPTTRSARFAWPVSGPIRRGFATGANHHDGIDIKAPEATMVRAAAAGTVRFAGMEKEQFGNLVVLDHGDGWFTAYAFLSRVTVKEGARVAAGERVGLVGSTGLAKGNELHFEVRQNGKPVDPLDELPKAP
ncbi:murein DD-endopeptidase MepM/ murein hydrolase activator NlpD [Novosphingobium sp. PhB57]|uniref:LysM peptidoglycan-binding domain-containing M23 family metallopeptidase n=1 Tax=Novosphingobium sp. PhB57 TaxID=2485107 RepID=UPI00105326D1|nr:LysM peptidoglycan-binding domain-containing M23 family metallopeptidase [Novosphingobium sp. PhB57]TCU60966.1 murein DD-endopeptidase MepM/ murein hydrolase activator NlpD [Novosphingobium sp. PhB57]